MWRWTVLPVLLVAVVLGLTACDGDYGGNGGRDPATSGNVDPTPENKYGVPSQEFEPEDIERAENASDAVKDYCSGAVSEAQRIGCESHVDESNIP